MQSRQAIKKTKEVGGEDKKKLYNLRPKLKEKSNK